MTTSAAHPRTGPVQAALAAHLVSPLLLAAALAVLALLCVPLLTAAPGPLTSDESLYVQEGFNIAQGKGYTYTTGEPVHHRAPLFPALLAADFKVAGFSLDHARWVPRLFALGSAALLLALGWRLFGRWAGLLAAGLALASALLTLMGETLFLDGAETFFVLLALLCLHTAFDRGRPAWAGAAGVALGLAFLTKESALLWLPLPFLVALSDGGRTPRARELLALYMLGFLVVAGWWWPYVFALTGDVYLLGAPSRAVLWLGGGLLLVALPGVGALLAAGRGRTLHMPSGWGWPAVALMLLAWGGLFLIGLEQHSTWPFSRDYLSNIREYTDGVLATWLRPLPAFGLAWGYVAYRAARGSLGDRLLLLALLLFLPFALFVANRHLHVRDLLPAIYLSYLALARAVVDAGAWLSEAAKRSVLPISGRFVVPVLLIVALGWWTALEAVRFSGYQATFAASDVRQDHWDNQLAQTAAGWIEENVEPGAHIMSGRLYYSHLYVLTDGRYPWWQLPTVRVEIAGEPPAPVRASTLFRWEDDEMPAGAGAPWLYLRQYPEKHYYIALSEQDLLTGLREHEIGYVVLTGDDAGFSSLSLLPYFEGNPAFERVQSFVADETNQVHVFRVDRDRLAPASEPARVSRETAQALEQQLGPVRARALLEGLSPAGYVLTEEYGAP